MAKISGFQESEMAGGQVAADTQATETKVSLNIIIKLILLIHLLYPLTCM